MWYTLPIIGRTMMIGFLSSVRILWDSLSIMPILMLKGHIFSYIPGFQ